MSKSLLVLLAVLFAPALVFARPSRSPADASWTRAAAAAGLHPCTTENDGVSLTNDLLLRFLGSSDSVSVNIRESIGLPTGVTGPIILETDTVVCRRLRRVLDSLVYAPAADSMRNVYMARVDTMFVVKDMESPIDYVRSDKLVVTRDYRFVGAWR